MQLGKYLKDKLIFILVSILVISCSEKEPFIPNENSYNLDGQIYTDDHTTALKDIEVKLIGEEVLKDTTDIDGKFSFHAITEGEHSITINHEEFRQFDSTLIINQDTSIILSLIKLINISGKVYLDGFNIPLKDIEVELEGDEVLKDTTDSQGIFSFNVATEREYVLSFYNSLYIPFDTTIFISNDASVFIHLVQKDTSINITNDYFPLSSGNWWSFTYDYRPSSADVFWHRQKGKLTWEVHSNLSDSSFIIEETIDGIELHWDPDYEVDTTKITKKKTLVFNSDENGRITIDPKNHFGDILHVRLGRYFQSDLNYITLFYDHFFWPPDRDEDLFIYKRKNCSHEVRLLKDIGISEIKITNTSNSGPRGTFKLAEYEIK